MICCKKFIEDIEAIVSFCKKLQSSVAAACRHSEHSVWNVLEPLGKTYAKFVLLFAKIKCKTAYLLENFNFTV